MRILRAKFLSLCHSAQLEHEHLLSNLLLLNGKKLLFQETTQRDYTSCIPLCGPPRAGDKIAYKVSYIPHPPPMRFLPVGPFMIICNSFGYLFNVHQVSDVVVSFPQVLELSASYTPELSNYKVFIWSFLV